MQSVTVAALALFGLRHRSPYYVVAPPFSESSAGNRALYVLVHALNRIGEEAYVALAWEGEDAMWAPSLAGLHAPRLTHAQVEADFRYGRRPVTVYPETFTPTTFAIREHDGLKIQYAMNYVGLLEDAAPAQTFDLIYAFSANIAARTPHCTGVLHVPVVNADYWTPGPERTAREGACVYAGKYVDHHLQALPAEAAGAKIITRFQPDSLQRDELRELFRRSTHLYIYENTALATEAALCGCPVVYTLNPFFDELISARETGLDGFTGADDPVSLARARATVTRFRSAYLRTLVRFGPSLQDFVSQTQTQTQTLAYARPFRL